MSGAVEVEGLRKSFGGVTALDGVDLSIPAGRVLGLLGSNGAGKTTLVRIVGTLLRPDGGRVLVCGLDVAASPDAVRREIGLAGQYPAIHLELTGREGLEHITRLNRLGRAGARRRTDELLEQFDLTDAADRLVKTYSGGMMRRLDLACALVRRPSVLLLDEPTVGLDPAARLGVWEAVRELVGQGTAVLLTTQHLDEADALADDIVVLDGGRVIESGTPNALKDRIGGDVLEVGVAGHDELRRAAAAVDGLSDTDVVCDEEAGQVHLAIGTRGSAVVAEVVRKLDAAEVGIETIVARRPSLDDVYLAATRRDEHPVASNGQERPAERRRATQAHAANRIAPLARARDWWAQSALIAKRNLLIWRRSFVFLAVTLVQPVMFLLLFRFVLGGAIQVPTPGGYTDYMFPGVVEQACAFASAGTALTLSRAMNRGVVDRYRSMAIARSAFLGGRLLADALRILVTLLVMIAIGIAIGLHFRAGWTSALGVVGLGLLLGVALCCVSAFIGMAIKSEEAVQSYGFLWIFPLTFVSSAFVPVASLPDGLDDFARHQPFTVVADAMRALIVGDPSGRLVLEALGWSVAALLVFAVLTTRAYNRRSA